MRPDIAHISNMSHHGSTRTSKKYGGRVRHVPDPNHLYENEFGGRRNASRRRGWMNINSSPIVGFLNKNLGRPWDDVYSEFCAVNDSRTLLGREMRKSLSRDVTIKGIYEGADGVVYEYRAGVQKQYATNPKTGGYDYNRIINYWVAQDTPVAGFYVHPRTGILCQAKGSRRRYYSSFEYLYKREAKPIEYIPLAYDYKMVDGVVGFFPSYQQKFCSEWYERELCGRRPRSRFYAWFHYAVKKVVLTQWRRVDGSNFAKNAHFEGVEVAPYVDPKKEAYYRLRPDRYMKKEDGFWYFLHTESKTKTVKHSVNRKQMEHIRQLIEQRKGTPKPDASIRRYY